MTALSPTQLLCNAKVKIKLETFTKENNMFKSLHFDKLAIELRNKFKSDHFKKCV